MSQSSAPIRTRLDVESIQIIDDVSQSIFAGQEEFANLQPSDDKAYVRLRICHSLPRLIGPEMNGGLIFGFHPKALARNFESLLHNQTNIGHRLAVAGTAAHDAINGCIIGVSFSGSSDEDWDELPTAANAPYLDVLAVMFKRAKGVKKLLGDHLSNVNPWSVSIETKLVYRDAGVFDSRDKSVKSLDELEEGLVRRVKGVPVLKKIDGGQLAWVLGGADGEKDFDLSGIGYVGTPAEKSARIVELAAAGEEGTGETWLAAASEPEFFPGQKVSWSFPGNGSYGSGLISEMVFEGGVEHKGVFLSASREDPVALITLPNQVEIIRKISTVKKNQLF